MAAAARDGTLTRTAAALALPWLFVCVYALRWCVLRWRARGDEAAAAVVATFYQALANGATAGYDKALLRLLHPALMQDGRVERGVVRAMARCTHDVLGPVLSVPRRTLCVRREGMQVHCVALVHFAKVSSVTCELTWVQRLPSSSSSAAATTDTSTTATTDAATATRQPRFHVTAFRVTPPPRVRFDVLRYLHVDEFEGVAETFVVRLLSTRPPTSAVAMLASALQSRYATAEQLATMQDAVARVVRAAGGIGDGVDSDVDATLTSSKLLTTSDSGTDKTSDKSTEDNKDDDDAHAGGASSLTVVRGIEMTYQVRCRVRPMEVYVCLGFEGMRCCVTRYELRLLPDTRTHVLHDRDTGTTTLVQ